MTNSRVSILLLGVGISTSFLVFSAQAGASQAIKNLNSGQCLGVANASSSNGAAIVQDSKFCSGSSAQAWDISSSTNDNRVTLVNSVTGKCLDLPGGSGADGAKLQQWSCVGNANQLWSQASASGGSVTFASTASGKCLDLPGGSTTVGIQYQQWSCISGNGNQMFTLAGAAAAASASYTFCANENGHCSFSGTQSVQYGANGTFVTKSLTGGTDCTNAVFGDPLPGVVKSCSVSGAVTQAASAPAPAPAATAAPAPAATAAPASSSSPMPMGVAGNWTMKFSDEFNGSSLDTSKWNTDLGWTNTFDYMGTPASYASVSGGSLDLKVDNQSSNGKPFTGGMITSRDKYSFQYGVAEARLQIPKGAGIDAAFWMIPNDGSWPPEIDVVETLTQNPFYPIMTYHWMDGSGNGQAQPFYFNSPDDTSAGMHTYSVNWQPNSITWYIDGVQRAQQTSNVTNKPMFIIAVPGVCTPGTWCASDMSKNVYPLHMNIDYIRVWQ